MIRITAIQMEGDTDHEKIERLRWVSMGSTATGENTLQEMVDFIEGGERVIVTEGKDVIPVRVVLGKQHPYLRTFWKGEYRDHLLDLPVFFD